MRYTVVPSLIIILLRKIPIILENEGDFFSLQIGFSFYEKYIFKFCYPNYIGYLLYGVYEGMGRTKDDAVSPAIGTILLVALMVVFVAVVAVVVMGLSGGLFDSKEVGLTLRPYGIDSESERGISLTVHCGADAGDLVMLSASLNGPELVYRETGASYVVNPQVGPDYRFKVVESNVIVQTTRGNSINVDLETTEILPVNATEYYVTVTGTFRDGTEQVLLIQRVTLPAISGKGAVTDENQYVKITPYSISDKYPGHGFIVTRFNESIDVTRVEFELTTPSEKTIPSHDLKSGAAGDTSMQTSYDISTTAGGSPSGWNANPYPNLQNYWALGELTGTVTVTLKVDDEPKTVSIPNIVVPPRVNIFEDTSKYAGEIKYDNSGKLSLTSTGSTSLPIPKSIYFISSGEPEKVDENSPGLQSHAGQTLEAYVKVHVDPTEVWYRVASVPVNSLLPSS